MYLLISYCAERLFTASGDMVIDDFNLFLPYYGECRSMVLDTVNSVSLTCARAGVYGYCSGLHPQGLYKIVTP